jgi:NitT/TauT family transport system permease protein
VTVGDHTQSTIGLGAMITDAANKGNFPVLLGSTLVMAAIVITGNRLVWRRLYGLAATRYRLD